MHVRITFSSNYYKYIYSSDIHVLQLSIKFFSITNFQNTQTFNVQKNDVWTGGAQKSNLLHKAGGRVAYFGYKHQRKVEKNFSNFNEKLKGVVKKDKKNEYSYEHSFE